MGDDVTHTPTMRFRWRWVIIGCRYDRVLEQLHYGPWGQRWVEVPTAMEPPVVMEPKMPPGAE